MYILPLLLWNLQNMEHLRSMDQDFVTMTDLSPAREFPYAFDYYPFAQDREISHPFYGPWKNIFRPMYRPNIDQTLLVTEDKDNFKVVVDVHQFKPEEVSVKVVGRWLVIEAKHEEKQGDHNSISRHFIKKCLLPERADVDQITSTISKNGMLTIIAPLKPEEPKQEKEIKIELVEESAEHHDGDDKGEANTSTEKKVEENEIREELTTQEQEEKEKPEK